MGGFEIPKINMFQQPIQQIGGVGSQGTQRTGGFTPGFSGGQQTAFEKDMTDFKKYLPAYNGTGQLQPKHDASLCFMA